MAKLTRIQLAFIYLLSAYYTLLFCLKLVFLFVTGTKFWQFKKRRACPKNVATPEFGIHKYIQLKNIKLHYVEAGDSSKPLMVFLHGFPEFWYSWRHQLKEFSKEYWCVAVDLRGFGESEKPPNVTDYKVPLIAEDIKELVVALGRTKFILIAHDWGGIIAWSFLDLYASMVDKYVILNAPHTNAWDKLMQIDKTQFSKSWYVIFYQCPYFPELSIRLNDFEFMDEIYTFGPNKTRNYEEIEAYKYAFGQPGAITPTINYYRNVFTTEGTVKRPVVKEPSGLFLFGELDVALSIKLMEIMPEVVPNLQAEIIKNAGHFVQQDAPIAVNKAIRIFLSQP